MSSTFRSDVLAGRVALVTREVQRPGMFRLEFSYQGTTSVFANDGTAGWQIEYD